MTENKEGDVVLVKGKPYTIRYNESQKKALTQPTQPISCIYKGDASAVPAKCCGGSATTMDCVLHGTCVANRLEFDKLRKSQNGVSIRRCDTCQDRRVYVDLLDAPEDTPRVAVAIVIPVRGQLDLLARVIALHRLQQHIKPYFILVDTHPDTDVLLKQFQSEDTWVTSVEPRPWIHLHEVVCDAMQKGFWLSPHTKVLQTHTDCIPISLYSVIDLVLRDQPVVGYQMSIRPPHPVWDYRKMVSHTFTLFDLEKTGMPECNLSKAVEATGTKMEGGWPDTECSFMWSLWQKGFEVGKGIELLGFEMNHTLDKTAHYWHCRSMTCGEMYAKGYYEKAQPWKQETLQKADQLIQEWSNTACVTSTTAE